MLTLRRLREEMELVKAGLLKKGVADAAERIEAILQLDTRRCALQQKGDNALAEVKRLSRAIGEAMKAGNADLATTHKEVVATRKKEAQEAETQMQGVEEEMHKLLLLLPNVPHESVPAGATANDNVVVREGGAMPSLPEPPLPHWEIAEKLGIIDFPLGVKITGAGFPLYRGAGARLQRALVNFFLDTNTAAGYEEIQPPVLVNEASAYATGQLPDKEGQMYAVPIDGLYLVPTAEVPVTNILRGEILPLESLPLRMTAYTPCFRREAGSYGKDVRGLNRLHQFDKVEIVCVAEPSHSYEVLEGMVTHVESLLKALGLPYRVLRLCGGDMSFTSALTYDLEVYSAAQQRWLEVSSVSNFEEFQANRLQLRFRSPDSKTPLLAHTLNGSALALPRVVAALLENNQTAEGVRIPAPLQGLMGTDFIPYKG